MISGGVYRWFNQYYSSDHNGVDAISFSPDGTQMVVAFSSGKTYLGIIDTSDGSLITYFYENTGRDFKPQSIVFFKYIGLGYREGNDYFASAIDPSSGIVYWAK